MLWQKEDIHATAAMKIVMIDSATGVQPADLWPRVERTTSTKARQRSTFSKCLSPLAESYIAAVRAKVWGFCDCVKAVVAEIRFGTASLVSMALTTTIDIYTGHWRTVVYRPSSATFLLYDDLADSVEATKISLATVSKNLQAGWTVKALRYAGARLGHD